MPRPGGSETLLSSRVVTTIDNVPQLPSVIALHDPTQCDCGPDPRRCITDLEAFCRAILNDHMAIGARTKTGGYTGSFQLSPYDLEECVGDLISEAWDAARKFDGRGRLAGWVTTNMHWRITDWKRNRYGSTRYGRAPIELTDHERDLVATIVDFTGPEVLDLIRLVEEPHKTTLERIVIPVVFGVKTFEDYSDDSGLPLADIHARVRRLGRYVQERRLLAA